MKIRKCLCLFLLLFSIFLTSCDSISGGEANSPAATYVVSNDYFVYSGFKAKTQVTADLVNHTSVSTPIIEVTGKCNYSLTEVSINAKFYSSNNVLLDSFSDTATKAISANTEFDFSKEVTTTVQATTASVVATFNGKSTQISDVSTLTFTVTFVKNNSTSNETSTVKSGKTVSKPANPTKSNYIFNAWYTDSSLTKEYDFSKAVTSNLTLYAKYTVDYATLTNKITSEIMKCNVTVYTKSYNTFLGNTTSSSTKSGSGIIFYESTNDYYFLLTNNHVSVKDSSYDKVSYSIEDYKGQTYTGYVKDMKAEYDLAVLYFKKGSNDLGIISRATSNPAVGDEVVSVGQPKGQSNAISYGKVQQYNTAPKLNNCQAYESNVSFNVMRHNANTSSGSSGGAILDVNLNLVGIHYAGATDSNGNFVYGSAIPTDKVNKFLTDYIWGK